jgi:hypothetical protein
VAEQVIRPNGILVPEVVCVLVTVDAAVDVSDEVTVVALVVDIVEDRVDVCVVTSQVRPLPSRTLFSAKLSVAVWLAHPLSTKS